MSNLRSSGLYIAIRRAFEVGIGIVSVRLLAFVLSAFIARVSGAETFGEYTLFITLFIIASEIPVAFDTTYIRSVARLDQQNDAKYVLTAAIATKVVYLLFISILLALFSDYFSGSILGKPDAEDVVILAIICGGLYSLFATLIAFYQQKQVYLLVSLLRPLLNALVLSVLVYFIWFQAVPDICVIANTYIMVILFLVAVAMLWFFYRGLIISSYRILSDVKNFVRVGGVLMVSSGISIVSNRLDVMFLSSELAYDGLAIYGVGLRMSVLVAFVTGVITTILIPQASYIRYNKKKLHYYLKLSALYLSGQIAIAVITIIFVDELIDLLFGATYMTAAGISTLLILQVLLTSAGLPFQALIQTGDSPHIMLWIALARLSISFTALSLFVPSFGLLGAGYAMVLTAFIVTLMLLALSLWQQKTVCVGR